ncbi:hypothetical protein E4T42_03566 [Aureobasidium subglaciale]|nr:hypothetical protein E4T42_03566 [Aureobasidium subglaciale]
MKGTEILTSLQPGEWDLDRRQALWGITCSCNLCTSDQMVGKKLRRSRDELEQAADELISASKPGQNVDAMTYPQTIYKDDMVRFGGLLPESRIYQSYHVLKDHEALSRHASSLLKRCGYRIEKTGSSDEQCLIPGVNSSLTPVVVIALLYLSRLDEPGSGAGRYEKLARVASIIINAEHGGFDRLSASIPT